MRLAESMFNLFGYSKKLRAYWNNRNAADDWAWCANTVSTAGYDANIEFLKKFGSRVVTDLMLAATIHKFYVHNYGTDDMYIQDWSNKTYNTVDFIIRLK